MRPPLLVVAHRHGVFERGGRYKDAEDRGAIERPRAAHRLDALGQPHLQRGVAHWTNDLEPAGESCRHAASVGGAAATIAAVAVAARCGGGSSAEAQERACEAREER